MDDHTSIIAQLLPQGKISPNLILGYQNIIPYLILLVNFFLFKLLRSLSDAVLGDHQANNRQSTDTKRNYKQQPGQLKRLLKVLIGELISTCELCADCAELNVVYEKHGACAYAAGLFLLSYLWIEAFGEAQTTPGYLMEELVLVQGKQVLASGETYARFLGQSIALPLAWRFASLYWRYQLVAEHAHMLAVENCKSSLSTSTMGGFFIELVCCLLCRLMELIGHKALERNHVSRRLVSLGVSLAGTLLVVLALELSGGYFNPMLAASLEYGCKGIHFYQHAIVFWLGPLMGHVLARLLYRRLLFRDDAEQQKGEPARESDREHRARTADDGRPRRTTSQRRKRHRD